jgi:uncharacterized lipoprotein YmbA
MKPQLSAILLFVIGLAGCAAGPAPIEYYVLAPPVAASDSIVERSNKPALVIDSVELAAYLRQTGMIIQTGENQLLISRNHLWAESLELALPKALVRELLRLRIDSLQSTDRGEVVSAGRYQLISAQDAAAPIVVDFNFQRDLEQDGYAYAVEQMSGLIGQIAGAILASVDKLEQER